MISTPINKNGGLYKDSLYQVFKSMQLASAYTLYYDVDFTKEEVQEFQKKMTLHNEEHLHGTIMRDDMWRKIKETYAFDCYIESRAIGPKTRLKMTKRKVTPKATPTLLSAATDAIEIFYLLCCYTMALDFQLLPQKFDLWNEKLKEFCNLYGNGLKDEDVFTYFMQECGLEITE